MEMDIKKCCLLRVFVKSEEDRKMKLLGLADIFNLSFISDLWHLPVVDAVVDDLDQEE